MDADDKKLQPERDKTDERLRAERDKADQAVALKVTTGEKEADELVERAREQADAVLDEARGKADHESATADLADQARHAVEINKERSIADEVVHHERAVADAILRRERGEHARTLATLLPMEREKTDRSLLTERTRSDDELAHRDDFLGMVSHDLRNLLSGIVGNAQLLSLQATESEEGKRTVVAMDRIARYGARMNRLIGDLIDVTSIEAGKLAINPTKCDAVALLTEAEDAFAHTARERQITLKAETESGELLAEFDRERILQVLANLISNSLKFTPAEGTIVASAKRDGDQLHLSVTDTGKGIPANMLTAVFERFWQVGKNDDGGQSGQSGLGLGLYISRSIVEAHGGRIWAESTLGQGSEFHVTLPIAFSPGATTAAHAALR